MKKNNLLMNKKGDIPTTILIIGIVLICTMALFSFFSSTIKYRSSFVGIGLVEKLNSQIEEKTFSKENPVGLHEEKNVTRGFLFWQKEVILFSAEYKLRP